MVRTTVNTYDNDEDPPCAPAPDGTTRARPSAKPSTRRKVILKSIKTDKTANIHMQVYDRLRRALMSGMFEPDQPISIRYLVDQLAISATPAREALKRLEAERALVKGANRTLTVPRLTRADLRDLCNIRLVLEGLAVEQAVGRIADRALAALEDLCVEMDRAIMRDDADAYLVANWAFHRMIYKIGSSELLLNMIEGLWMRIGPFIRLALPREQHLANSMKCHRQAIEALGARDRIGARAAIAADISDAAADLESLLTE